jgi:hypothetical protein
VKNYINSILSNIPETNINSAQNTSLLEENESISLKQIPHIDFSGSTLENPMSGNNIRIAGGLCLIVEAEGPMLAKRAYDVYLRHCGIQRLGRQLKSIMNRAMQYAINNNKIESDDEWSKGGLIYTIVRKKNSPPIKLRTLGSRLFGEIPPSELQVASLIIKSKNMALNNEAHLRTVLELYGLRRLTDFVKSNFKEANKNKFSYVENFILQNRKKNF